MTDRRLGCPKMLQDGARGILRLGADPQLRNARGESAVAVATARGHDDLAEMLRAHAAVWSGWGITELACVACLYHDERFTNCVAYLRRMIERDAARRDALAQRHDLSARETIERSVFRQPLPSGLRMIDIAARMETAGCLLLREECPELWTGAEEEEAQVDPDAAAAEAALETAAEAEDGSDEGWTPPCVGYMVCSLCHGRSGSAARWGAGSALHPTNVR